MGTTRPSQPTEHSLSGHFAALIVMQSGSKVDGKHRFFAWLMIQCKILTADKLLIRNWPCDPLCQLCLQEHETASHLILHCVYAKEVWMRMSQQTQGLLQVPEGDISMEAWWNSSLHDVEYLAGKKSTYLRWDCHPTSMGGTDDQRRD